MVHSVGSRHPQSTDANRAANLISVEQLAAELSAAEKSGHRPPVLLDVRWEPLPADHPAMDWHQFYLAGHIPGAVYVDLDEELAAPACKEGGRHPLPNRARFQEAARSWGLNDDDAAVVYDETGGQAAARLWWLLRYYGFRNVRVLDGGLPAWQEAHQPIESGQVEPEPGKVYLTAGHMKLITADDAERWTQDGGELLDARGGARYRGEIEPMDPVAGHIPGARSAPTNHNLIPGDLKFRPSDELRHRFAHHNVRADGPPVAVYCGSGITAAHEILALATIGVDAALYDGSWSHWVGTTKQLPDGTEVPVRPIATGSDLYDMV
jgi:thiosulfate/3-mercaptopyruvate sulfurtransferase